VTTLPTKMAQVQVLGVVPYKSCKLVEFVVGSCPLTLRDFYLGAPVFLSPQTPTFQMLILSRMVDKEPL